eukprot:238327_1
MDYHACTYISNCVIVYYLIICIYGDSIHIPITNGGFEDHYPPCEDGLLQGATPNSWTLYDPYNVNFNGWSPGFACLECLTCSQDVPMPFNDSIYGELPPEGHSVLYLWTIEDRAGAYGVEQTLSEKLAPDLLYTLTVKVGNPGNNGWFGDGTGWAGYIVQLLADNTVLSQDDSSILVPDREWRIITVHYATSSSDPMIGKPIKIRLLEKNDESIAIEDFQAFLLFDDARLTATASTTTTIEPTNAMITTTAPDTTNVMIATTATDTSNVMITTKHTSNNTHLHGFVSTDGMNSVNIDNDSDDSNIIHFASRMHLYIIYIPAAFLFVGVLCGVCVYCRKNRKQSGQKVTYTTKNEKNQKNIVTKPGLDLIRVISVSRDQSDHQTQGQSNETKPQRYVMTDTPDLNVESTPGMTTDPTVDSTVSADPTMMYEEVVVTEGELHHPNMEPDEFEVIGEDECETGATKGYTQSHKNEMEGITTETKRQSAVELQMIEANNDEVSVGFVSIKEAKSRTGAQREKLLNDDDFFTVFGMTRNAFYQMPQWKQKNAKRSNGLF